MDNIVISVLDKSKIDFILELLSNLNYIRIENTTTKDSSNYNFLESRGIWKDYSISSDELRKNAWQKNDSMRY